MPFKKQWDPASPTVCACELPLQSLHVGRSRTLWIPAMCKTLPMISLVPWTLFFPILPYFAGKALLLCQVCGLVLPRAGGCPAPSWCSPRGTGTLGVLLPRHLDWKPHGCGLQAPGADRGSVSLQKQEHVRNITVKILSFSLPAAAERLPSPGLQSVCLLSTNIIISLPAFKLTPNILTEQGWEEITFAAPLAHPRGQQPLSLRQQQPQGRI